MTRFLWATLVGCGVAGSAPAVGVIPLTPRLPGSVVALIPADADDVTDPAALAKRIAENVRTAGDKLHDRDAGADTRKAQAAALRDIDKLLDQAENPPPMPMPMPMPMGGGGGSGQPQPMPGQGKGQRPSSKPGGQSSGQRPSWRDKADPGDAPMGQKPMDGQPSPAKPAPGEGQPMPGAAKPVGDPPGPTGAQPGGDKPGGPNAKPGVPFDDAVTKQVWGHLPERLRQEVNQYYKEQFMPKYGDLLRQYYADLAEREKAGPRK